MESAVEKYKVENEPYYLPVGREVELFQASYSAHLPVMLKGPTGCGKTRFVEYMAYKLGRHLITVACHEDLSSTDLVGRFLLEGDETVWHDGPLTAAVRSGAICYLPISSFFKAMMTRNVSKRYAAGHIMKAAARF